MFKLNLLTPERKAIGEMEVKAVIVPTASGEVDILPGHVPMLATLGTGVLKAISAEDKKFEFVISWGYCEVSPAGVNVLAEFLQTKEEVTEDLAKEKIIQAQSKLTGETLSDEAFEKAIAEVSIGQAGLQLLN